MDTAPLMHKLPLALALAATLMLGACANQNKLPDNAAGLGVNAATPGSQQDFTVNVGDRVFFETDSSQLTIQSRQTLDRQAQWLLRYPNYPATLEGHADERGTREYNLALGARRAAVTRDYLVSKGVPRNRLNTVSFGKERPVAVCANISCWSQNRRTVTVLSALSG